MREKKTPTAPIDPDKAIKQTISRVASTDDGLQFFQYLVMELGLFQPSISADQQTGEINVNCTIYNEAKRDVWLRLRQLLPYNKLAAIELPPLKPKREDKQDVSE